MSEHPHLQRILDELQTKGERLTGNRKQVLAFLCKQTNPVSIKDIEAAVPKANIVTLYRIIEFLVERGIVVELTHDPKEKQFELASPYHQHHHHAVCTNCDKVFDIDCEVTIPTIPNFKPTSHTVTVYGVCEKC